MKDIATIIYHFFNTKRLETKFKTKEELQIWQQKKINNLIKKTLSKSPFYQQYLHLPFSQFPIINKKIMMENFSVINIARITKEEALRIAFTAEESRDFLPMIGDISVGLSSGTSGGRGIFMANNSERLKWAGIMLAKALPNGIFASYKVAFFLRANNRLYTSVRKSYNLDFNFFDLTKPFSHHLNNLQQYQPNLLIAPASILLELARLQEQKKINISPMKIFSVAEVLDAFDREYIEKIFQQCLSEIYQCTEGFLAITDQFKKLRLNEEYLYVEKEWIDKKSGRFVPIITDFSRTTQPIVRYRLDDVLIEDFCDKPFTYLKAIEGRCDDICFLESKKDNQPIPIFSEILRNAFATNKSDFSEYKIIQHTIGKFEIMLQPDSDIVLQKNITESFAKMCERQLCKVPELQFTKYQFPAPNQKLKRIENRCKISTSL